MILGINQNEEELNWAANEINVPKRVQKLVGFPKVRHRVLTAEPTAPSNDDKPAKVLLRAISKQERQPARLKTDRRHSV